MRTKEIMVLIVCSFGFVCCGYGMEQLCYEQYYENGKIKSLIEFLNYDVNLTIKTIQEQQINPAGDFLAIWFDKLVAWCRDLKSPARFENLIRYKEFFIAGINLADEYKEEQMRICWIRQYLCEFVGYILKEFRLQDAACNK